MTKVRTRLPGMVLAIGLAGPINLLIWGIANAIAGPPDATALHPLAAIFGSLLLAPLSIPFGAMFAAMPVVLGSFAMSWLGTRVAAARRPLAWAAAGGICGIPIAIAAAGWHDPATLCAFVATAIACALLARVGVW